MYHFSFRIFFISFLLSTMLLLCPAFAKAEGNPSTPGKLTVASLQPEELGREISRLVVRFSEQMRPLGYMEEEPEAAPLSLRGESGNIPAGKYRWLDVYTLAYVFDAPQDRPLSVDLCIPAGTESITGSKLDEENCFHLATPSFKMHVTRDDDNPLSPDNNWFEIVTNYPVNAGDLKNKTTVTLNGKNLPLEFDKAWESGGDWHYPVGILGGFPSDAGISLHVAPGVRLSGGFSMDEEFDMPLPSYASLDFVSWEMSPEYSRSGNGKMNPSANLALVLSNPVLFSALKEHLVIFPEPEFKDLPKAEKEYASKWHHLDFVAWQPNTAYAVTIKKGLQDKYGTILNKDVTINFETGNFTPYMSISRQDGSIEANGRRGILPISLLNVESLNVRVRYLPWDKGLPVKNFEQINSFSEESFRSLSGSKEISSTLAFPESKQGLVFSSIDIPALLGMADESGSFTGKGAIALKFEYPYLPDGGESPSLRSYECIVQLTDMRLSRRGGWGASVAWLTDSVTGEPVSGGEISLLGKEGNLLWEGTARRDGIILMPGEGVLSESPAMLVAKKGNDSTAISLDAGFFVENYERNSMGFHVLSQLPLYQPGQQVNFSVFAANLKQGKPESGFWDLLSWEPVRGKQFEVAIRDSQNREIWKKQLTSNEYGMVSGELALNPEAPSGDYYALVSSGDGQENYARAFRVASFRLPDFRVDLTLPKDQPIPVQDKKAQQELSFGLEAAYLSGLPLNSANVYVNIQSSPAWHIPASLVGYTVGDGGMDHWRRGWGDDKIVAEFAASLNEQGKADIAMPPVKVEPGKPLNIAVTATVSDVSELTGQGTGSFTLHPSAVYVGLRSPSVVVPGDDFTVSLKTVGWDNSALGGTKVMLSAGLVDGKKDKTILVWEKEILLEDDGDNVTVSLDKPGRYDLVARVFDEQGRENLTRVGIFAVAKEQGNTPMPLIFYPGRNNGVLLTPDQEEYTLDDDGKAVARIMFTNPYYDSAPEKTWQALVTTERLGVRSAQARVISGSCGVVEIPLRKGDSPYVFVSVTIAKGALEEASGIAAKEKSPAHDLYRGDFTSGSALLKIKSRDENIPVSVSVSADKDEYRPGGKVRATVLVSGPDGKPLKAQVTLLAVDERVLLAAGDMDNGYNPGRTFSPSYAHWVREQNNSYLLPGFMARQKSLSAPRAASMAEDSAGLAADQNPTRANFSPSAFWLAAAETDAEGRVEAQFDLPDSITEYRIVAVAVDAEENFATADALIKAVKPLQVLSALPKFLTGGDELEARFIVQNNGSTAGDVIVRAEGAGLELLESEARFSLQPGESRVAKFAARVYLPGDEAFAGKTVDSSPTEGGLAVTMAGITVSADMGGERDSVEYMLPVKVPQPLTYAATAGILKAGESKKLPICMSPAGMDEEGKFVLDPRSRLEVSSASSPAAGLSFAAQFVLDYPWGCTEQRLSKALVRALRMQHGTSIGLEPQAEDPDILRAVMNSLPAFQRYNGGFGVWKESMDSDPYLTAYALAVFSIIESHPATLAAVTDKAGEPADGSRGVQPPEVIGQAVDYLHSVLEKALDDEGETISGLGFICWALSIYDKERLPEFMPEAVQSLIDSPLSTPMDLAGMMLALDNLKDRVPEWQGLYAKLQARLETLRAVTPTEMHFAARNPELYHATMGSSLRDNGLVLVALSRTAPDYGNLEALALWLSRSLADRKGWLTTQEGAFALLGIGEYLQHVAGNDPAGIKFSLGNLTTVHEFMTINEPPQTWGVSGGPLVSAFRDMPGGNKEAELVLSAEKGNPYWTARLGYAVLGRPVQAENMGFVIDRNVSLPDGQWRLGDVMDVTLILTIDQNRKHVLLFEPFPAGFEPIYASRVDLMRDNRDWTWSMEDVREDGILLYTEHLSPGTYTYKYKLRAMAPGVFVQRPTQVEEMYTPEVFGRTGSSIVKVKE